jgi:mannose-6-phosphate isomerase-like protein (cupin superfamily)
MRTRLFLPCLLAVLMLAAMDLIAQTPAPPATQTPPATGAPPQTPKPTPPARRRPVVSTAPTSVTVTLTDASGAPIDNVKVSAVGAVNRQTLSIDTGVARLNSVRPGDYRVRFEREGFITLERDITVKGGSPLSIDVTLTPAPPPPPAPEPPKTNNSSNAPPGQAQTVVVVDFVEKNFIRGGDPQKEDELGCTASARTALLQVREPFPERALADADETLYVVAGEGTLRLGNKDITLTATTLAIVPRGTVRSLSKKGKNPLIVLSTVSGPPCTK